MSIITIDNLIISAFLLFTLFVGIWSGKGIQNIKEYSIGNKTFSYSTLTATITATWIGAASLQAMQQQIYKEGVIQIIVFTAGICEMFLLHILGSGIEKFRGALSAAEIVGKWFNTKARVITGIAGIVYSIGIVGTQIAAIGAMLNEITGISPAIGILIGAGIVVAYSSFGGIKSVTYTDVIQFIFFMVAMPLIAATMLNKVGGYHSLLSNLPAEHLKLFPSYKTKTEYLVTMLFFAIPFCDACLIQRMLMAKNIKQIKFCFNLTALCMAIFTVVSGIIALSIHSLNIPVNPSGVLYHVVDKFLPVGIRGIAICGMLAVLMSTADSYLNVCGVFIVNDIINVVRRGTLDSKTELFIIKGTTLVVGVMAILFALSSENIMQLLFNTWLAWAPIAVVPLYAALLNIRSNFQTFIIISITGIITVIFIEYLKRIYSYDLPTAVISVVVNTVVFGIVSIYYHRFAPDKLLTYGPSLIQKQRQKKT